MKFIKISQIKFHLFVSVGITFLVFLLTTESIINLKPIQSIDKKIIDTYLTRRGFQKTFDSLDVVIVGISNETLKELPERYASWPIARNLFAHVIENLNRAGARVIGIDLLFGESDKYSSLNDSILARTIKKYGNVVLAGKLEQSNWRFRIEKTVDVNYGNLFYGVDSSIGIVNVLPDEDGILRTYIPVYYDEITKRKLPSFSFAVVNKFYKLNSKETASKKNKSFEFNQINIPAFTENSIFINYYGPGGTFKQINFIDVLDDKNFKTKTELELDVDINTFDDDESGLLQSGIFKDKIVLIGSIEPEDKDLFPVPVHPEYESSISGNLMYGVEIHANVVQMLIDQNFVGRSSLLFHLFLVFVFVFSILILFEKIRAIKFKYNLVSEFVNIIIVAAFLFGIYELFYQLLLKNKIYISLVPPGLGVISAYVGGAISDFLRERKQKLMIKGMFSQYLNPNLVNELINHPETLKLGGIRKDMTVLFSDLANFTTMSERVEPEVLVEMLNKYFDEMTEIIFETRGTLDKFEGDAIMAFWNAPIDDVEHHFHASLAALKMKKKFLEIKDDWKVISGLDLALRIGINSGEMIVGNMGGKKKFDYTVMGDNVNLAARLESINKVYGSDIIISENVYKKIKDYFITRELDLIVVKGKTVPVKIFQLIDLEKEPLFYSYADIRKLNQMINYFEAALNFYREKNFLRAIEVFEKVLLIEPDDKPTRLFIDRCFEFLNAPPPDDWDGVFESKIK